MKFSSKSINKSVKILLFFLFVINTAAALWTPLFSVFIVNHIIGATLATVGIMSVFYSVTRSVLQIPIAKYLDSHIGEKDDYWVIFVGILLASICSFLFLAVHYVWQIGLVQILWGIADSCTMAAYYAIFSHHIDKKSAALEWSLYSVGGIIISGAIGALLGGFVAQYYGFTMIFIGAGVLNILSLLLLIILYPYIKIMRKL